MSVGTRRARLRRGSPDTRSRSSSPVHCFTEIAPRCPRKTGALAFLQEYLDRTEGRPGRKGQGLVEFALVAPFMIFLLLITVDFARVAGGNFRPRVADRYLDNPIVVETEHKTLTEEQKHLEALLGSERKQWGEITRQIGELKKVYGPDKPGGARRTKRPGPCS